MKRNKRRAHARLKPYLWDQIAAIADKFQTSYTDVMEMALEKGLTWYIRKIRKELDKKFLLPKETNQAQDQENNKYEEEQKQGEEALDKLGMTKEEAIEIAKTPWVDNEESNG